MLLLVMGLLVVCMAIVMGVLLVCMAMVIGVAVISSVLVVCMAMVLGVALISGMLVVCMVAMVVGVAVISGALLVGVAVFARVHLFGVYQDFIGWYTASATSSESQPARREASAAIELEPCAMNFVAASRMRLAEVLLRLMIATASSMLEPSVAVPSVLQPWAAAAGDIVHSIRTAGESESVAVSSELERWAAAAGDVENFIPVSGELDPWAAAAGGGVLSFSFLISIPLQIITQILNFTLILFYPIPVDRLVKIQVGHEGKQRRKQSEW
ncbi:hypothetical protein BRADI_5g18204v3 [Brachypodium distachyon]|uniref:Uncharacterized protein n=1 Tax=Brachypodium distachyon TaxID=15368 RepID=A0A2K2CHZ0_BRADI|nr:hypothetical protein BRADI_5g18204v3 [Brachypodium distachyon]